ncbi:hypothetical protein AB0K00_25155 [Dactylosporangium sp. NPDC049525]|uniref:hypothetical protein n=1 Tax=Dactylosporangium sp. NPDC049525 TaxID=3154730 RepID=UPI00342A7C02
MRKLLGMLCGVTLLVAGCSDDGTPTGQAAPSSSGLAAASASVSATPSASPTPSPSPSPLDPAVAANTRQVCDELKKVMFDETVTYLSALSAYGDANSITDPAKQQTVLNVAKKGLTAWAKAVRPLSPKASNPALRKAIDDQVAALDDTAATLQTFEQVKSALAAPQMQVAGRETKEICG